MSYKMVQFDDFVTIVRHISQRTCESGIVAGNLVVDTTEKLAALKACEAHQRDTGLSLVSPADIADVALGGTVQVEIRTPRPGFGLLAESMDALIRFPTAHVKEPAHYYLLDSDYANTDSAPPIEIVSSYRTILAFVRMLKSCSAFLDEQEELLVFVNEGKFEIPVRFAEADIRAAKLETIDALARALPDGTHAEQCASIMAEAVHELTAKLPSHRRLVALLENADDLKDRFEKGYKLFAAGFSYEKIRDEIEATRVEYAGKIHKVLSDIQNQLLGIPVATIIVATQMKENKAVDGSFWMSAAVLVGSFVFMLLMHFLLRNQRHTLEVIGIEINRQKAKLEKEHAAIAENFVETFRSLDGRYRTQRAILYVVDIIVVVGFLLSVFFFYKLSLPTQQWTASIF